MKNNSKNLLMAIAWAIVSCLCVVAFFVMILCIPKENKPLVQAETAIHNETLELILSDFSCVLALDNVKVEIEDEEVKLYISGEACDLSVVLNKELEVQSSDTIVIKEKTVAVVILVVIVMLGCFTLSVSFLRKYISEIRSSVQNANTTNKGNDRSTNEVNDNSKDQVTV